MPFLIDAGILLAAYLTGSIPFGLIVVKLISGRDVRAVASGRTGGTNAMRAAGVWAGILTGTLDVVKGAAAVWLARAVTPEIWMQVLAPLAAILGNNASIFLVERTPQGGLRLRGGAGGAAAGGGAFGLWPPVLLILLPLGFLVWYGVGYASLTTISIALIVTVVFAVRAALGLSPWAYAAYGVLAGVLLLIALRPNLRRLREGTERLQGWRARRRAHRQGLQNIRP